jgi:hypothetical protein
LAENPLFLLNCNFKTVIMIEPTSQVIVGGLMTNFFIALGIGIAAGLIDAVPMLLQKMDKFSCLSAFFHWLALGLIIPFVHWNGLAPWLTGLIIGELSAVPVILMVFPQDRKAMLPMIIFSAVLGIGVALAGAQWIG